MRVSRVGDGMSGIYYLQLMAKG
eukprot:COSAG02_NODE_79744_length_110_cov_46.090909_1_plen_22_part_01